MKQIYTDSSFPRKRESSVLDSDDESRGSSSSENIAAMLVDCCDRTMRKDAVKVEVSKENTDSAEGTDLHRFVIPAQSGIHRHSTVEHSLHYHPRFRRDNPSPPAPIPFRERSDAVETTRKNDNIHYQISPLPICDGAGGEGVRHTCSASSVLVNSARLLPDTKPREYRVQHVLAGDAADDLAESGDCFADFE